MHELARQALESLLDASDRSAAGVRSRAPALTASRLTAYRALRSLSQKEAVEGVLMDAEARGAVVLSWDGERGSGFVSRVDLRSADALAQLLGRETAAQRVEGAASSLAMHAADFPVLAQVFDKWRRLERVRSLGPQDAGDFRDAIAAIQYARHEVDAEHELPLRSASAAIFGDSKRLERLAPAVDVLLAGAVDAEITDPDQLWRELGFYREEQLVRLSGAVVVERPRLTALLDAPMVGLPASAILGARTRPRFVMSIENQTTFNIMARAHCGDAVLLIYTGGMPSPSWRKAYGVLLESLVEDVPVFHWGDFDEGGFRIAARIASDAVALGRCVLPWKMHPSEIPEALRRPASPGKAQRMGAFAAAAGWRDMTAAIVAAQFTVEQEALHDGPQLPELPGPVLPDGRAGVSK
jgi:hypothetical protein